MFTNKQFLMIPGPTPVPEEALIELAKHPLPHRSKEFSDIFTDCNSKLKQIAQTEKAIPIIYAASGTGAMEATLVNILNPGEKVISIVNGVFSQRWADMAKRFGADVITINIPPGQATTKEQVSKILEQNPDTKIVLATFSETSTGVKNPIQDIASLTKDTDIILAVDAITGLGAMPLYMDDWGIDIVVSGSQKGFMIPPGLSFLWLSPKALDKHKNSTFPRYYWDWTLSIKALEQDTTAFTPNVSLICALSKTLSLMTSEGISNIWERHNQLMNLTRQSIRDMGLDLLAEDDCASAAITSIVAPPNISVADIRKVMKEKWHIIIADGQKDLKGKIFRIGHLGYVCERDVLMATQCLQKSLQELSHQ